MQKKIIALSLLLFAILEISPVVFLATGAFMDSREIIELIGPILSDQKSYASWRLLPRYPTMKNLVGLLFDSPEFFQMFWNTVKITGGILLGQMLLGMPAAWGLARYSFRGKRWIYLLYVVMMMMPFQVTMLSEYLVLDTFKMLDTSAAVILPGMFSTFPVFIMYRFFGGIPESVLEAARMDGAGEWQVFVQMGIPLGISGIRSVLVLSFLECWCMIEQPMTFLKTKSLWPLSMFLPQLDADNIGMSLCASLLALLPAVFVFLAGQDDLEQGIASWAGKEGRR